VGKAHYYDLDARAPIAAGPLFIHQLGRLRILGGARCGSLGIELADLANRTGSAVPQFLSQLAGPYDEIAAAGRRDSETD
jgi:hypothetical protein